MVIRLCASCFPRIKRQKGYSTTRSEMRLLELMLWMATATCPVSAGFYTGSVIKKSNTSWCTNTRLCTSKALSPEESIANQKSMPTTANPWYSDARVGRDRSQVLDGTEADWNCISAASSRFVLHTSQGQCCKTSPMQVNGDVEEKRIPSPLWWSFDEIKDLLDADDEKLKCLAAAEGNHENGVILAWAGSLEENDYWVVYAPKLDHERAIEMAKRRHPKDEKVEVNFARLREFGDSLFSSTDAAILGTCNGLVEFHKTHPFCAKCGSSTRVARAGASRKCMGCGASTYPRIDVAAIMLITSQCENYALLGRKHNWPKGRYSTLAGFVELGETLEQCCARETREESGVEVDLSSVKWVSSQPWPFPRSLMAGFRGKAKEPGKAKITIDANEMEDIRWFHRDYVKERLDGGSTALSFEPNETEKEFHIPGRASLARLLISQWANEV